MGRKLGYKIIMKYLPIIIFAFKQDLFYVFELLAIG